MFKQGALLDMALDLLWLRRSPSVSAMPKRGDAWHGARLIRGFGSALGLHCFSSLELSHFIRSFVLALSALHLTHSDTPPEGDFLIHPLSMTEKSEEDYSLKCFRVASKLSLINSKVRSMSLSRPTEKRTKPSESPMPFWNSSGISLEVLFPELLKSVLK